MSAPRLRLGALALPCALALLCALAACGNKNNTGPAFPFERAEHMQFTCFAPLDIDDKQFVTLPAHCCKLLDPSDKENPLVSDAGVDALNAQGLPGIGADGGVQPPPECRFTSAANFVPDAGTDAVPAVTGELVGTPPLLHALVTQSARGEVAAVDLVNDKVLDSDRLTPGFTFLDTGGLPTAIVQPSQQPRVIQPEGRGPVVAGPQWTYVSSAEQFEIRALATCRFRSGGACGPDSDPANSDALYQQRTRVPLPAAPRDMILGPGPTGPDQALFVTMPDLGVIARVELAETETVPVTSPIADGPTDVVRAVDAFMLDGTGTARAPIPPLFFRVPVPDNQVLGEPIDEVGGEYTAMCGFGYDYTRAHPNNLPHAPRAEPTNVVQPNLMHYDAESQLLLVTDRVAPVLHVFRFASDGTLVALPAVPTGTAVRDFTITPRVPDNKPVNLLPSTMPLAVPPPPTMLGDRPVSPPEDPAPETKRYLYAIDDRGLVMLFEFLHDAGTGTLALQPLLSPQPGTTYDDRIDLPVPVTSLDVIDTRSQSDYVCGEENIATLNDEHAAKVALNLVQNSYKDAVFGQIDARRDIYNNADSTYIRGVFLAVGSASGTLSLVDIHDLDVYCRARKFCCGNETCTSATTSAISPINTPRDSSQNEAVAVRRHSVRRASLGVLETVVPNAQLIKTNNNDASQCVAAATSALQSAEEPYRNVDGFLCMPPDPWYALSETWSVIYHGSIPNTQTTGAALEPPATEDGTGIIRAPLAMNFCDLGVLDGDYVAVLGKSPDHLRSNCPNPQSSDAALLEIKEAHDSYLVVQQPTHPELVKESTPRTFQELSTCYPDSIGIELRAGSFLVTGLHAPFVHRVIANPDPMDVGHCIEDATKDPLLTSRTQTDMTTCPSIPATDDAMYAAYVYKNLYREQTFINPYVSFRLTCGVEGTDNTFRDTSVQILQGSSTLAVTSVPTGNTTTDALPVSVRYEPLMGQLYLLDTASQGLRRYLLQPFEFDTHSFE